jgi:hypothetical protein
LFVLICSGRTGFTAHCACEREDGKAGFRRTGVGSGKGAECLAVCRVQTAEVRGTEGWFGVRIKKRVRDRSWCRKRTRDGNDALPAGTLLLLTRWGCARLSTRGCCGGGDRLLAVWWLASLFPLLVQLAHLCLFSSILCLQSRLSCPVLEQ